MPGDDEPLRSQLRGDETDLAVAVDVQHRVLYRPEPVERTGHDGRLDPRGQDPRHDIAGFDSEVSEAGRGLEHAPAVLAEGDAPADFVDREHEIRGGVGPAIDEIPQRGAPVVRAQPDIPLKGPLGPPLGPAHRWSRGRPSTRSATMLRWISDVPP
ncbi:MAG TPA: hypothetical protein VM282_15600 [Acidimicrobiales bacterium]|nr:hypothetical protein [Acidimicrobiales bacterium]